MSSKPFQPNLLPKEKTGITSQRKIESNRQNAQLSTGPKSLEGKNTSSCNAYKHGLLTKDAVVTTRAGREDQNEFDKLLAGLRDCYRPNNLVEDLLVQELANSYWRSARAVRCERGDLTCAGEALRSQSDLSESQRALYAMVPAEEAYDSLHSSSRGLRFLLLRVEQTKDAIRKTGVVTPELCRWLAPDKKWDKATFSTKESLLDALEKETERLTAEKVQAEKDEFEWRDGRRDSLAIPDKGVLDRINRYETTNRRHRYKVEARLDQLQARRKDNANVNPGIGSGGQTWDDTTTPPTETDTTEGKQDFCETKPTSGNGSK
jgi:hypothetical protein